MERDLIELESRGWHALATRPQAAADFYNEVLDNDVVMLLPARALISSTYVRRDSGWRLVFHQQTPMS